MAKGIFIAHDSKVNWKKIHSDFILIIAGTAFQSDKEFESNYKKAKSSKIPIGLIWHSVALNIDEAKKEADECLKAISGKEIQLPIFYEIEECSQIALGKNTCKSIANTFLNTLKEQNYNAFVHSSSKHLFDDLILHATKNGYEINNPELLEGWGMNKLVHDENA